MMKENLLVLVFLGVAFFVLPVVQASASLLHDHKTISPFDKQKYGHKLHCELNKHHFSNTYCPHGITEKKKEKPVIASDCGGKTSGTLPAVSSYTTSVFLSYIVHYNFELALISREVTYTFYGFGLFLPDQIDHPPQTV